MGRRPHSPYPEASGAKLALPQTYPHGTGMLTRFPFGGVQLGAALGPANPLPTTVAEEPLPFRRRGFSPLLRCYYRRDFRSERVHRTSWPGFEPTRTPPYRITPQ